jgi:hypothetical protein
MGQGVSAASPEVGQNDPSGHAKGAIMPAFGQNEPAGHGNVAVKLVSGQYAEMLQAVGAVSPYPGQ